MKMRGGQKPRNGYAAQNCRGKCGDKNGGTEELENVGT